MANPTNLTVTGVTSSTVSLSWTDNSSDEIRFRIERWTGSSWTLDGTNDSNDVTYTAMNLSSNTQYSFRVYAWNTPGSSWWTNVVTTTTSP